MLAWKTAIAATAAAVQSATASAPHRVERRQNSAAMSSGDSAAYPESAYWTASSKMFSGAFIATT